MYLHIVPKLFHRMANKCSLKSISIPEFNLTIDDKSLSVGDRGLTNVYGLECEKEESQSMASFCKQIKN